MRKRAQIPNLYQVFAAEWAWLLRHRKGFYSWILRADYLNLNAVHRYHRFDFFLDDSYIAKDNAIRGLLQSPYLANEALDIVLKALLRAETRLVSRFVPQRSHEERLTGHFISEIGGAIDLVRPEFDRFTHAMYSRPYPLEFLYFDASKGGKLETESGADFGLIIEVDLPDMPKVIKGFLFQAKKLSGNAQINLRQLHAIQSNGQAGACYVFYDMSLATAFSPLAITCEDLASMLPQAKRDNQESSSITEKQVLQKGLPFCLFIMEQIMNQKSGMVFESLAEASQTMQSYLKNKNGYSNFLTVLGIGRDISYQFDDSGQVSIY